MKLLFSFCVFVLTATPLIAQDSLLQKGIAFYSGGEYHRAIENFSKAAVQAEEKHDSVALQTIYSNLANSFTIIGKAEEALQNYQRAERIALHLKDTVRLSKIIKNIGALYNDQQDFKMAIQYFERSEKLASAIQADDIVADCKINKAIAYEQLGDLNTAVQLYKEGLKTYEAHQLEERMALTYNNLGIVYKLQNNFPESLFYYKKTLDLAIKLDDQYIQAATYTNIANVHRELKNYESAIAMNEKALAIATAMDAPGLISDIYENLSKVYAQQGNYKQAYDISQHHKQIRDSLINVERNAQLAEMREKYEAEKKETENIALKQQVEIRNLEVQEQNLKLEKRNLLLLASGFIIVLLTISTLLYFRWQKVKNERIKEEAIRKTEEEQRKRFARDLHDDLGSGLTKINTLSSMASKKTNNSSVQKDIFSLSNTAKELIGNMREMIWALDSDNLTFDYLVARIREYSFTYLEEHGIMINFNAPFPVPAIPISSEANRYLFLITKEILQNILKHSEASEVTICIEPTENELNISIRDNGKGLPENLIRGHGMNNLEMRTQQLNGKIIFDSGSKKGCEVKLFFNWQSLEK